MSNAARRHAPVLALALGLAAALAVAGAATAEPASIAGKRADAERVLGEIRKIDSSVARAAEAYNLATMQLGRIERSQRENAGRLVIARTNLGRAQETLQQRVVALYTGADQASTIEVLLGATSLDDLLARLEAVERVSSQDAQVLERVRAYRQQVRRRKAELARARARQSDVVAERAAHRSEVERQLAERRSLLSSIQGEIARLEAEERARAAAEARRARARLAAQARAQAAASSERSEAEPGAAAGELAALGVAAETPEAAVAPPSHGGVVGIAMQYLGVPYVWGGASPSGFDCSGFIMYVYSQVGVSLPHNAAAQYGTGTPVSRDQLSAGDLVFFDGLGHNGIYIGGGQFIHSPHTGDVVKISSLLDSWYASTYVGARRI